MHRFRKKSDAKRNELTAAGSSFASSSSPVSFPIVTRQVQVHPPPELPTLPPASDFRTSLILPDLSKRFTLLRTATGNSFNLEDLRSRFAEQRAKGAENQITEEEEDMLLDMLSRIGAGLGGASSKVSAGNDTASSFVRTEPSSASLSSSEAASSTSSTVRQSTQSTTTMSSAGAGCDSSLGYASSSSRASKRHSNNLFAGQFRDMRYMRKTSNRTISSNRSVLSSTPSDSTTGSIANALIDSYSDSPYRPVTPENRSPPVSVSSGPNSQTHTRSTVLSRISSIEDGLGPLAGPSVLRLSKQLTNGQLKRMSVSLEEVIREIEEADDQVLVPRSFVTAQQNGSAIVTDKALALTTHDDDTSSLKATAETSNESSTMSWVADMDRPGSVGGYRSPSPYRAGGSTSPVPRVPGYIPGMPRPVTPARETDVDDVRSHSTTPRATSPSSVYARAAAATVPLSASASSLLRQGTNTSPTPYSAGPSSPLPSLMTQGGRSTPEDHLRTITTPTDYAASGSHWRRPSSPLSSNSTAFQSLNGGSRPGTPSNVTWNVSGRISGTSVRPLGRNGTLLGHSRNQSSLSVAENQDGGDNVVRDALKGSPRSTNSPSPSDDTGIPDVRNKFLSNGSLLSTSALGPVEQDRSSEPFDIFGMSLTPDHDRARSFLATSIDDNARSKQRVVSPLLTPPSSPFAHKFHNSPLFISPMSNNSSRSSLVSAGSSYHSWEEDNGFGAGFIHTRDRSELPWHEVPPIPAVVDVSNRSRSDSLVHQALDDPESTLRQFTGLSKLDLLTIQGKLLEAAQFRSKNTETRSPSTLRRRRPSTAQSVHSAGGQQSRTTSPAPQQSRSETPWTAENAAKANALLNSVVESIGQPDNQQIERMESEDTEVEAPPSMPIVAPLATSSPGRRNKDLADILFGSTDAEPFPFLPEPAQESAQEEGKEEVVKEEEYANDASQPVIPITPKTEGRALLQPAPGQGIDSPNAHIADPVDLMRQVQERTEAAMAQLRRSPQHGRSVPGLTITRKKIHLQDISGPLLVQSSTSIDKIPTVPTSPLKPPQLDAQRSVKLSLSKRLRKTLRSKNAPNGDEVTPWTNDGVSISFMNSPAVGNRSLAPSKANGHGSITDLNLHPKPANISPPASAGPSLKSFMSRFRKKGQPEGLTENDRRNVSASDRSQSPPSLSAPAVGRHSFQLSPSSTPLLTRVGSLSHAKVYDAPAAPSMSRQPTETPTIISPSSPPSSVVPSDPAALKQFYEAAQSLGLDQTALNEFLARSQPASGKGSEHPPTATLTYSDSNAATPFLDTPRAFSPLVPEVFVERPPADLSRNASQRQYASSPVSPPSRRIHGITDAHGNSRNTIVRRTIIFPSASGSTTDAASLSRRASKSRRRASGLSVQSNRSVHDRVPTPPPLRVKRQSVDSSPPVPTLPSSWSNQVLSAPHLTPEIPLEKSNSIYDSFYDMYIGDRAGSVQSPELLEPPKTPMDEGLPNMEEGQALEVIELANGETIWSIVNGLRADDAESFYPSRGSLDSEYSAVPHDGDNEQLFFREHVRTGSKGSNISSYAKRKSQVANRPETKVFYSSSAQIAHLIEQLSHNTEAASFNIKPKVLPHTVPGHSHSGSLQSESDVHWTVEERLEHMLGSLNTTS